MFFNNVKVKFFSLPFVILLLLSSQASGFSITPMFLNMTPNGSNARSTITVTNSSPRPMPVIAGVSLVSLDINGSSTSTPANDEFIIFPAKAIIKPHSKQTFRIQWRGQPNLAKAKTYEISVSQVLAKDHRRDQSDKKTSINIQLAMAFGAIINMRAAVGTAKPVVKTSRLIRNKKGTPTLETTISNNSNQSFLLIEAESTVTIFGANKQRIWSRVYSPDEIKRRIGLGAVQPNKTRRMQIPISEVPTHIANQAKSVKMEIRPSAK